MKIIAISNKAILNVSFKFLPEILNALPFFDLQDSFWIAFLGMPTTVISSGPSLFLKSDSLWGVGAGQ